VGEFFGSDWIFVLSAAWAALSALIFCCSLASCWLTLLAALWLRFCR